MPEEGRRDAYMATQHAGNITGTYGAGVGAFVSDWFVEALQPAMKALGINDVLPDWWW